MTYLAVSRAGSDALLCLYQHRLMSTSQLQRLLTPQARSPRYMQRQLAGLRAARLADAVTCGSPGAAAWFLTEAGAVVAERSGQVVQRPYRMTAEHAVGPLQHHTLAVTETGIAFVAAARERGDTCGPLDWIPEVAHPMGTGCHLICDALLSYVIDDGQARTQVHWFIELDRATMPVARLAAKLDLYTRYQLYRQPGRSQQPAWRQRYRRFPTLLVILDGASDAVLDNRIRDLAAVAAAGRTLRRGSVNAAAVTLARLREHGPFAPIFTRLGSVVSDQPSVDALVRRVRHDLREAEGCDDVEVPEGDVCPQEETYRLRGDN